MSGGALASLSIVLVGLSPYITASVITQLLTKAIPKLEELHKDGETGRRKINQWTRIITFPVWRYCNRLRLSSLSVSRCSRGVQRYSTR